MTFLDAVKSGLPKGRGLLLLVVRACRVTFTKREDLIADSFDDTSEVWVYGLDEEWPEMRSDLAARADALRFLCAKSASAPVVGYVWKKAWSEDANLVTELSLNAEAVLSIRSLDDGVLWAEWEKHPAIDPAYAPGFAIE